MVRQQFALLPLATIARLDIQRMEEAAAAGRFVLIAKSLRLLKRMQLAPSVASALLSSTRESVTMLRVAGRKREILC